MHYSFEHDKLHYLRTWKFLTNSYVVGLHNLKNLGIFYLGQQLRFLYISGRKNAMKTVSVCW